MLTKKKVVTNKLAGVAHKDATEMPRENHRLASRKRELSATWP